MPIAHLMLKFAISEWKYKISWKTKLKINMMSFGEIVGTVKNKLGSN